MIDVKPSADLRRGSVLWFASLAILASCFVESPIQSESTDTTDGEPLGGTANGGTTNNSPGTTATATATSTATSTATTVPSEESESTTTEMSGCTVDAECDDDNACTLDICDQDRCTNTPSDGVLPDAQVEGDCRIVVCVYGEAQTGADPTDIPDDDNPCTVDGCSGDEIVLQPAPIGLDCGDGSTCDGDGNCSECTSPAACVDLPPDDDCQMRTCENGMCGLVFAPLGVMANATLQTPGDCRRVVCDGMGGTTSQPSADDPIIDGLECTEDLCIGGEPANPLVDVGTPCAAGECNDNGFCAGCNDASDCGNETPCQSLSCSAQGVCGVVNAPGGTPLPNDQQIDGDCQIAQCDGNGAVTSMAANNDEPGSDGLDCTAETCTDGMPQTPDAPLGSPCDDDGGSLCDGAGDCVDCIDANDCPAAPECSVAVCSDSQCMAVSGPVDAPCSDNLFCTANDACDEIGQCVGSGDPCAGPDGDADCNESCNENDDSCTAADPDNSPCDDGFFCTTEDDCNGGVCEGSNVNCPGPDDCEESCQGCCDDD